MCTGVVYVGCVSVVGVVYVCMCVWSRGGVCLHGGRVCVHRSGGVE